MTALLTSCVLLDERMTKEDRFDDSTVRMSYAMALIRFVNGMLDQHQQSQHVISLFRLAELTELPSFFVELRHIATHEYLPSLEMLRFAAQKALKWMDENYWQQVVGTVRLEEDDVVSKVRTLLTEIWRTRKKKGLGGLDEIKNLREFAETEPIVTANVMIFAKDGLLGTSRRAITVYGPILKDLGEEFARVLFEKLLTLVDCNYVLDLVEETKLDEALGKNDSRFLIPRNEHDQKQAAKWAKYLLSKKCSLVTVKSCSILVSALGLDNRDDNIALLKFMKKEHADLFEVPELGAKIDKTLDTMEKFRIPGEADPPQKRKLEQNTLVEAPKKKRRVDTPTKVYLFEKYDHWTPIPFGCPNK